MTTYLAYVDDSGDETTAVYTAILVPVDAWSSVSTMWLQFRAQLFATYEIPADFELHATELIGGKTKPSPRFNYGRRDLLLRARVLELAAAVIGRLDVRIVTVVEPHVTPDDCYRRLLRVLDRLLAAENSWAIFVVDGDGSAAIHTTAHRELDQATRRILEDPWYHDSAANQLVQVADIASFTVFQAHRLRESRRFMWGWMRAHLHAREWPGYCRCPVT